MVAAMIRATIPPTGASEGSVGQVAQCGVASIVTASEQQVGLGGGDLADQVGGGEIAVGQQQHSFPHASQKAWGISYFAEAGGPEDRTADRSGATRDHGEQPQHRVSSHGMTATVSAVYGHVRR
nr:hypothetical protein [Nocardia sp. SYP-A9097]